MTTLTPTPRPATHSPATPARPRDSIPGAGATPWLPDAGIRGDGEDVLSWSPSRSFLQAVPISFARRHQMLGLVPPAEAASRDAVGTTPEALVIAAVYPDAVAEPADALRRLLRKPLRVVRVDAEPLTAAIGRAYQTRADKVDIEVAAATPGPGSPTPTGSLLGSVYKDGDGSTSGAGGAGGVEDLLDGAGRAPVVKVVNALLFEAVQLGASDVHIQPQEDALSVRMRVDGALFDAHTLPGALSDEIASRVKVMAKMNIAEKRLAQDGRATAAVGDRAVDLRVSSVPTTFGEQIVIRLLDKGARLYTLPELGMDPVTLERFRGLIRLEHGLILVTGPTGSGKSTTLYAALQEVATLEKNLITLEDPVEYQLDGVSQIQVNRRKGMTFADGLRSVLRQDPDTIMVGEVRDHETAVLAIQAALTGHLVYSTLHTNDAASAVTRLLDLGIEPYLAASSVIAVLAQRLVRRVCPDCAEPIHRDDEALRPFLSDLEALSASLGPGASAAKYLRGRGCEACRGAGYRGRHGLFELLIVDDAIRRLVNERAPASIIKQRGLDAGMQTLRDGGLRLLRAGQTTPEEIARVTTRATV